jgi:sensor histidine kinase YesM
MLLHFIKNIIFLSIREFLLLSFSALQFPKNLHLWIILVISGLIIVISVLYILDFKKKYQKRIFELEQRFLLTQMNPHFVFNSLTAIQSYIFRNEPYLAGKYLANFSKLVRLILENSRKDLIPISKEVETLTHYLELQSLRFEEKFEYSINIDSDIDVEHQTIPPMLAQPFIENAIEHGIIHLSKKGIIKISFILLSSQILLEVEDNGVGFEKSMQINQKKKEHESLAIRITNERLQNLKKVYRKQVKMEIKDLSQESAIGEHGTLIRFTIPML